MITVVRKRNQSNQSKYFNLFSQLIILPIIIEFVSIGTRNIDSGFNSSIITTLIYLTFFVHVLITVALHGGFLVKDLRLLSSIYLVFFFMYLISPNTRIFFVTEEMFLIFLFYVPVMILVTNRVRDWKLFRLYFEKYALIGVLISTIGLLYLNYELYINYMIYSYNLLPITLFLIWNYKQNRSVLNLITCMISIFNIVFFGARATFLAVLLFIIILYMFDLKKRKRMQHYLKFTFYGILIIFITISFNRISNHIVNNNYYNVRTIKYLFEDNLIRENETRLFYYENAITFIEDNPIAVNGLFGDRLYFTPYVHNIFLEIFLSFGIVLGSAIICASLIKLVFIFAKNNQEVRIFILYLVISFMFKFLFSRSFVIDGTFYIFIFTILSINRNSTLIIGREIKND